MEIFKRQAHNLYSIEREEEFIEQTASKVLPLLLDGDKQHLVMTKLGDAKGLQRWMVSRNKTAQDVLPNFETLKHVLGSGNMQCLKWMLSFRQRIEDVLMDKSGQSLSDVIAYGYLPIIKQMINIPRVLELCKNSWKQSIVVNMFRYCENMKVVDYVLDVLEVSKTEHLIKILSGNDHSVWYWLECDNNNSVSILKRIVNKIGETEFVEVALNKDNPQNVLECAIASTKMDDIEYLFSMQSIRARYDCTDDLDQINEAIYRILYFTFVECKDDTVLDYILNELHLEKRIITRHLQYSIANQITFGSQDVKYNDIVNRAICLRSLNRVKKIMEIIGETRFFHHVFKRDGSNRNGFDKCIEICGQGRLDILDTFKYLMSFSTIKEKCMKDINILWTMIWMFEEKF
eukprot:148946_1